MQNVINELNQTVLADSGMMIRLYRWEKDSYLGYYLEGMQGMIDKKLKIEEADFFIGIMWKTIGTPVKGARSGTIHEYDQAFRSVKKKGHPQILFFFNKKAHNAKTSIEIKQSNEVAIFKRRLAKSNVGYGSYNGPRQFEQEARKELTKWLERVKRRPIKHNFNDVLTIYPINKAGQNFYYWDYSAWKKKRNGQTLQGREDQDFLVKLHFLLKAIKDLDLINIDFAYLPHEYNERAGSKKLWIDGKKCNYSDRLEKRITLMKNSVIDIIFLKRYMVSSSGPFPWDHGDMNINFDISIHDVPNLNLYTIKCKLEGQGELKILSAK